MEACSEKIQLDYRIARGAAKQYDRRRGRPRLSQEVPKIPVCRYQYSMFCRCALQNDLVFCRLEIAGENV